MGKKRRTEITVETSRVLVMSGYQGRIRLCPACSAEVKMLTVDEAAALTRLSPLVIFRMIEARQLHYLEIPGSPLLVCLKSLSYESDATKK